MFNISILSANLQKLDIVWKTSSFSPSSSLQGREGHWSPSQGKGEGEGSPIRGHGWDIVSVEVLPGNFHQLIINVHPYHPTRVQVLCYANSHLWR